MADKDDLSEVLGIFKEAIDTPIENSEILQKRKDTLLEIGLNSKLDQYSKEMSCTTAFDELFSCYSVGGQFKNYYRYGELNPCALAYEKFTFCISNSFSSKSDEEKKLAVQKFYKRQFLIKKAKGSSEDVWEAREK